MGQHNVSDLCHWKELNFKIHHRHSQKYKYNVDAFCIYAPPVIKIQDGRIAGEATHILPCRSFPSCAFLKVCFLSFERENGRRGSLHASMCEANFLNCLPPLAGSLLYGKVRDPSLARHAAVSVQSMTVKAELSLTSGEMQRSVNLDLRPLLPPMHDAARRHERWALN